MIAKLRGPARDSLWGKSVTSTDDLMKHLKKRVAPGRDYNYYNSKMTTLRMKQGDSVGDFLDRLKILANGAKNALLEEMKGGAEN